MLKLVCNNLFFRNVTYYWNTHTNICITSTENTENRAVFIQWKTHNRLLEQVITKIKKMTNKQFLPNMTFLFYDQNKN